MTDIEKLRADLATLAARVAALEHLTAPMRPTPEPPATGMLPATPATPTMPALAPARPGSNAAP